MEIRKAALADVSEIEACVNEAFKDYIPLIGKKPAPMLKDYKASVQTKFAFVAEVEGRIAGTVVVHDTEEAFMWLDVLAVFNEYKGMGIGGKLIAYAEDFIEKNGKAECRIYTNVKFEHTIAIYKHLGYTEYQRAYEDGYDRVFLKKSF